VASKDQNSIDGEETKEEKMERALCLFLESVHKADHSLRGCAHNQKCYHELMEVRDHVLDYLHNIKRTGQYNEWTAEQSSNAC
jgi:hypothetical protein